MSFFISPPIYSRCNWLCPEISSIFPCSWKGISTKEKEEEEALHMAFLVLLGIAAGQEDDLVEECDEPAGRRCCCH